MYNRPLLLFHVEKCYRNNRRDTRKYHRGQYFAHNCGKAFSVYPLTFVGIVVPNGFK